MHRWGRMVVWGVALGLVLGWGGVMSAPVAKAVRASAPAAVPATTAQSPSIAPATVQATSMPPTTARATSAQAATASHHFHPVIPARVVDTRTGQGASRGELPAGSQRAVQVAGVGGIPSTVGAVVLNLTVVAPRSAGYASLYPTGTARPASSVLNFAAGQTRANQTMVVPATDGRVTIYTSTTAHYLVDVAGYYETGSGFHPAGTRVIDTRRGLGAPTGRVAAGGVLTATVAGRGGVPASGVRALVLNVTTVDPSRTGHLSVWAAGEARPGASASNYPAGGTVAAMVVVRPGAGGAVNLSPSASAHLLVDVLGWVDSDGQVFPLAPTRRMDTRLRAGDRLAPGQLVKVSAGGIPGIPAGVQGSVVINVVMVNPSGSGYVEAFTQHRSGTSVVNAGPGAPVSNSATVRLDETGGFWVRSSVATDLIIDVTAWLPHDPADLRLLSRTLTPGTVGQEYWHELETVGPVTRIEPVTLPRALELRGPVVKGFPHDAGTATVEVRLVSATATVTGTATIAVAPGLVRTVDAGSDAACAVVNSRYRVQCWGYNIDGQIGVPDRPSAVFEAPEPVAGLPATITDVQTEGHRSCAIDAGGQVWCWGKGPLGSVDYHSSATPRKVQGLSGVRQLAIGGGHTCAFTDGGSVWCWGQNVAGQLGNGSTNPSITPVQAGVSGVSAIAATGSETCALSSGTVRCWGAGPGSKTPYDGIPKVSTELSGATQLSGGCAVKAGGVLCIREGEPKQVQVTGFPSTVGTLSAVQDRGCMRLAGGTWCFGNGTSLPPPDSGAPAPDLAVRFASLSDLTELSQSDVGCGLTPSKAVHCWGGASVTRGEPVRFVTGFKR